MNEPIRKNVVQDVVPKRSIRNIELPVRTKRPQITNKVPKTSRNNSSMEDFVRGPKIEDRGEENGGYPPENNDYSYEYQENLPNKKKSKKILYLSISLIILVLAFGVSALFKKAIITITPHTRVISMDSSFDAEKDLVPGSVKFQVVSVSKEMQKSVSATGSENVSLKSGGTITIFNETSQSQRLIATTRFETTDGLVFRIPNAVTVPARTTSGGRAIPGSIDVVVEADQPGDKYNIGLNDFTVPGFKGDPKYNQIYARSKTEMTGGFVGARKVISADVLSSANSELENELKDALISEIKSQIPDDFVLFNSGIRYEFSQMSQISSSETESALIKKTGTARAFIFDRKEISNLIVQGTMPEFSGENIDVSNLEYLTFFYDGSIAEEERAGKFSFGLSGEAEFVWLFDENQIISDVSGLPKNDVKTVISGYSGVKEAIIEIRPFWNRTVPKDQEKIDIVNTFKKSL